MFFNSFPIGQKGAPKSMDETVWRLLGAKRAHGGSARGSDLGEGPLGLASRARRLEDSKIRRSEVQKIRRSEVQKIRKDRILWDRTRPGPEAWRILKGGQQTNQRLLLKKGSTTNSKTTFKRGPTPILP